METLEETLVGSKRRFDTFLKSELERIRKSPRKFDLVNVELGFTDRP